MDLGLKISVRKNMWWERTHLTDALFPTLRSLDVGSVDEIITTPLSWVATKIHHPYLMPEQPAYRNAVKKQVLQCEALRQKDSMYSF